MFPFARWGRPWSITRLEREMDELFDRFSRMLGREEVGAGFPARAWSPAIESYTKEGNLVIRAEVPGIDPKDIDISVTGNQLTIKGERKSSQEVKEQGYFAREIAYGAFERTIPLPEGVNPDKIEAKYASGILEITVPAAAEVKAKKISIKT